MKSIIVRTQFEALHQYKTAPDNVAFLRYPHRHLFKVEVEIFVQHGARALEFFTVKLALDDILSNHVRNSCHPGENKMHDNSAIELSCEDMAEHIANNLAIRLDITLTKIKYVEVSEDGENAGRYYS